MGSVPMDKGSQGKGNKGNKGKEGRKEREESKGRSPGKKLKKVMGFLFEGIIIRKLSFWARTISKRSLFWMQFFQPRSLKPNRKREDLKLFFL